MQEKSFYFCLLLMLILLFFVDKTDSKCQVVKNVPPSKGKYWPLQFGTILDLKYKLECTKTNLREIYNNFLKMDGKITDYHVKNSQIKELKKLNFMELLKSVDCYCENISTIQCDDMETLHSEDIVELFNNSNVSNSIPETLKVSTDGVSDLSKTTEFLLDDSKIPKMLEVDENFTTTPNKGALSLVKLDIESNLKRDEEQKRKTCQKCKELCINYWKNVTELCINNAGIETIHKDFFSGFYDLHLLDLSNNKISKIEEKTFIELSSLEELNLSLNLLKEIKEDHFAGLYKMRWLYLSHNEISQMPTELFGINWLNVFEIDLSHNKIKKMQTQFPLTLVIRLNNNEITGSFNFSLIPEDILHYLDISNNKIDTLINLSETDPYSLNLSHNQIKNISGIGRVVVLDLSFNDFTEDIDLWHYPNVEYLNLSHNNIKQLSNNAFGFNLLKQLSLSHNNISVLHPDCFARFPFLEKLDLSNNNIRFNTENYSNSHEVFKSLKVLNLDISENNFKVDWYVFSRLKWTENLNISGNDVPYIDPENLVHDLKNLKSITIDNTMWLCEELDKFVLGFRKHNVKVIEGISRYVCEGENN